MPFCFWSFRGETDSEAVGSLFDLPGESLLVVSGVVRVVVASVHGGNTCSLCLPGGLGPCSAVARGLMRRARGFSSTAKGLAASGPGMLLDCGNRALNRLGDWCGGESLLFKCLYKSGLAPGARFFAIFSGSSVII